MTSITGLGRNQKHLLNFMDRAISNGAGGRFSFAYRDRATTSAVKSLERRGLIRVDWVTHQISLDDYQGCCGGHA